MLLILQKPPLKAEVSVALCCTSAGKVFTDQHFTLVLLSIHAFE